MTKEQHEKDLEITKFDVKRDITPEEKEEIDYSLNYIYKEALISNSPTSWEVCVNFSKDKKILFPEEKDPQTNEKTFKKIEYLARNHFEKGQISRYLNICICKKILYPEEWVKSKEKEDYYFDKIIWRTFQDHLENINDLENLDNSSAIFDFFDFAQKMKIFSPTKFDSLDLQKALGLNIWITDIKKELENCTGYYWDFVQLSSAINIIEYPTKIEPDPLEWVEMEEEGQKIKNDKSILDYIIYSAKRKILSSKKIKITEESFDLIF